jgi:D-sedoheptulose 7-phosphate isomerase
MIQEIRTQIECSLSVKQSLLSDAALLAQIEQLVQRIVSVLRNGGKVIFAGNGGSFADAQHLSAEFVSRFAFDRAPLASVALSTNNSTISAIGNDYGYEQIFARELQAIATPKDIFIPISTSGQSPNILAAAKVAKELGIATVGLTGRDGGTLRTLCECLCMPSTETPRIQECHILIGHIICGLVEKDYFK